MYFVTKYGPNFWPSSLNWSKSWEDDLGVIFDQWPMLNLGFDVEPEIWILKVF